MPIDGSVLREKALSDYTQLFPAAVKGETKGKESEESKGWPYSFRNHFKLKNMKLKGAASVNVNTAKLLPEELKENYLEGRDLLSA